MKSCLNLGMALLVSALLAGCQTQSTAQSQTTASPAESPSQSSSMPTPSSGVEATSTDGASGSDPAGSHEDAFTELDERLTASMGEFDSMILDERARIGSGLGGSDDSSLGSTGGAASPNGMGGDDDYAGSGASGEAGEAGPMTNGTTTGANNRPTGGSPPTGTSRDGIPAGNNGAGEHGVVPADIPGGEDDDIVARQIREAALNEPDPELREKLWDEYRRYKGLKP